MEEREKGRMRICSTIAVLSKNLHLYFIVNYSSRPGGLEWEC